MKMPRIPKFSLRPSVGAMGTLWGGRGKAALIAATGISGVLMAATTFYGLRASADSLYYRANVDRMASLNERVARDVPNINTGQLSAFISLYSSLVQYRENLSAIQFGSGLTPPMGDGAEAPMERIDRELVKAMEISDGIMEDGEGIVAVRANIARLNAASSEIVEEIDRLMTYHAQRGQGGIATGQLLAIASLKAALFRVSQSVGAIAESQSVRDGIMTELASDINGVRATLHALYGSPEARQNIAAIQDRGVVAKMNVVTEKLLPYLYDVEDRLPTLSRMTTVKTTSAALPQIMDRVSYETDTLRGMADNLVTKSNTLYAIAMVSGLLVALFATLLAMRIMRENRRTADRAIEANDALQDAIASLLGDISTISGGDLTVRARVTENDVTGVIADAFNKMSSDITRVVERIKQASQSVDASARDTTARATQVIEAVESQMQTAMQAAQVMEKVGGSAESIRESAASAMEAAKASGAVAARGKNAVDDVIRDMTLIREHIQDASKRLKRVGESSQEIGQIGEIIADIARRTNVLALNASVQAAAAGEAGRAFAAVATEVQRLAGRADDQLKKIQGVVNAMQDDTREAIASMEGTTQKVVSGTESSRNAGEVIAETGNIINSLTNVVGDVLEQSEIQRQESIAAGARVASLVNTSRKTEEHIRATISDVESISRSSGTIAESIKGFKTRQDDLAA